MRNSRRFWDVLLEKQMLRVMLGYRRLRAVGFQRRVSWSRKQCGARTPGAKRLTERHDAKAALRRTVLSVATCKELVSS
jgi:hypothetical protein